MRQVVQTGPITPADELRALLTDSEKRIANLRNSGAGAVDLLRNLDRIADLWAPLEAAGLDLTPEAGRWDTIQAGVRRQAPRLVKELVAAGGAAAVRQREDPGGTGRWWWRLDEEVRERNRARLVRSAITLGLIIVVGFAAWQLLNRLFPVDPVVRETMRVMDAGDALVQKNGDLAAALVEYRKAAEVNPQNPDAWLRIGAVLEQQGDAAGAAEAFARAENVLKDPAQYRLARGVSYFTLGLAEPAERELGLSLDADPENPYAYYYLASVYETLGDATSAVDALEKSAQYAEERGDTQLTAMARYRMGILMQARAGAGPTLTPTP